MNYLTKNISKLSRSTAKDISIYNVLICWWGRINNHKGLEESRATGYGVTHLIKLNQDSQKW